MTTIQFPSHLTINPSPLTSYPRPSLPTLSLNLPTFSIARFVQLSGAQQRRQREECAARWITPGLPPLAMSPELDWKEFEKNRISSKLRQKMLFPTDPEKRSRYADLEGEAKALFEYWLWLYDSAMDVCMEFGRRTFYSELYSQIRAEEAQVAGELEKLFGEAEPLGQWEHTWVENDGRLRIMEYMLKTGLDMEWVDHPTVVSKYGDMLERTREEREKNKEERRRKERAEALHKRMEDEKSMATCSIAS